MSVTTEGAVYDRGYRPYDGPRGGRWAPVGALWRASIRRALGIRRSWRQKIAPWVLLAIATVPAIVNVGIGYVTRDVTDPDRTFRFLTYREYVGVSSTLLAFVALVAPDIVCPDRRNRVLPLIFSRTIDGRGYVLAKLGAIVGLVFGFGFLPHVLLFVGQMLVSDGALAYAGDNLEVLWKVPLSVAVLALYYGSLGLAVASLTARRIVGGVAFLGSMLVTGILTEIVSRDCEQPTIWAVFDLIGVPLHVRDLIFLGFLERGGPLDGVSGAAPAAVAMWFVVVGASIATLLWRYREAEAAA